MPGGVSCQRNGSIYSRTPAPAATENPYGARFWLKVPTPCRIEPGRPQLLPADACHAPGHGGQFVTVIPSQELVVVRPEFALDPEARDQEAFMHDLLAALEDETGDGPHCCPATSLSLRDAGEEPGGRATPGANAPGFRCDARVRPGFGT